MSKSVFLSMGFQSLVPVDLDSAFEQLIEVIGNFADPQVQDVDATLDLGQGVISLSAEVGGKSFLEAEGKGREVLTQLMRSALPELKLEVVSSDASLARKQLIGRL